MRASGTVGGAALAALLAVPAAAQDDFGGLVEGPGQEDVFYNCGTCHSLRTVTNQRLQRWRWDQLLTWMVDEQGMAELDPETRASILEYLVAHYGVPGDG
jgi:cytochrome c